MTQKENMQRPIYIHPYARTLRNEDQLVAGCFIGNGKWLKVPARYYDFLTECVNQKMNIKDILQLCDSEREYNFYNDLLKKLFEIGVFTFEEQDYHVMDKVSIDMTSRCNLRCRHCSTSYGDIPAIDMEFDRLKCIISWCEKNSVKDLTLTGGEIFLLDDIMDKLQWIREHFSGNIAIMTNGTLIQDDQVEQIKEYVDTIDISLDGFDAESVEKIRGKGVYDKVVKVIKTLKASGMQKIGLSMVLTKENWDHESKFIELCEKLDVKPVPRTLSPNGRARKYYNEFKQEKFDIDQDLNALSFRASCLAGQISISFFANGQMQPCSALDLDDYKMGNIDQLLAGTFQKPDLLEWCIVDRVKACKECNVRYFCASHCQSVNEAVYKDEELRLERCKNRKQKLQEAVWPRSEV